MSRCAGWCCAFRWRWLRWRCCCWARRVECEIATGFCRRARGAAAARDSRRSAETIEARWVRGTTRQQQQQRRWRRAQPTMHAWLTVPSKQMLQCAWLLPGCCCGTWVDRAPSWLRRGGVAAGDRARVRVSAFSAAPGAPRDVACLCRLARRRCIALPVPCALLCSLFVPRFSAPLPRLCHCEATSVQRLEGRRREEGGGGTRSTRGQQKAKEEAAAHTGTVAQRRWSLRACSHFKKTINRPERGVTHVRITLLCQNFKRLHEFESGR